MSQQIKVSDETYKRLKKMSEVLHWTQGYCVAYLLDLYEGMPTHAPEKSPSFKALHNREPVPGVDFNPNGELCQDDHEYLMGTGRYSDDAKEATK